MPIILRPTSLQCGFRLNSGLRIRRGIRGISWRTQRPLRVRTAAVLGRSKLVRGVILRNSNDRPAWTDFSAARTGQSAAQRQRVGRVSQRAVALDVVKEDLFAPIASTHDMIHGAGILYTQLAGQSWEVPRQRTAIFPIVRAWRWRPQFSRYGCRDIRCVRESERLLRVKGHQLRERKLKHLHASGASGEARCKQKKWAKLRIDPYGGSYWNSLSPHL